MAASDFPTAAVASCTSSRNAVVADVKAEVFGRDFFQFVRLVENDGAVVRQNARRVGLPDRQIRKEQMMIHDHDVRFHRLLPHQRKKAAVEVHAFRADASFAPRIQSGPEIGVLAAEPNSERSPVSRGLRPIEDFLKRPAVPACVNSPSECSVSSFSRHR